MDNNENSGALFKNDRKTRDSQPGWKGSATIDGKEYWVSCWVNEGKATSRIPGQKYLSIKFTEKEEEQKASDAPATDFDDNIPF